MNKDIIACNDGMTNIEELPLPIVLYPGFYGAYFGFKENNESDIYFCSCSKKSIENFIKFKLKDKSVNADPERNFLLDSMYFPLDFVKNLIKKQIVEDSSIIKYINFKDNLCHECNKITPSFRYCIPMYGGQFIQHYGWYVNKEFFEQGLDPINNEPFIDEIDKEIKDLIKIKKSDLEFTTETSYEEQKIYYEKMKLLNKQNRQINKKIENKVRQKFGFKNIGEAWTNETLVYKYMQELFPDDEIIFHYRPKWLDGLEIDVFNNSKKIGIEYQGQQHFKPIDFWGGEEALLKTQERDVRKKEICKKKSVTLFYVNYWEEVSKDLILSKIKTNIT